MISYKNIYSLPEFDVNGDYHRFKSDFRSGFNVTDDIDLRFFKLLFYFYNDDEDKNRVEWDWFNGGSTGLLAPTWLDNPTGDYYKYNSAWAYLKNNYEEERADALKSFVSLLSSISSESPWYFQKITGVDEALSREKWKAEDERKKISIECLNDPIDHRIESLLSLYRSIVWSHTRKCEVLPANLRKFDMGLFIFSGLLSGVHVTTDSFKTPTQTGGMSNIRKESNWAPMGHIFNPKVALDTDRASYKYIEFHNCEISMDSIKSGYNTLDNSAGIEQTFTIDIYFDDCYEYEYNPFILKTFGDFFIWDSWEVSGRTESGESVFTYPDNYLNELVNDSSPLKKRLEDDMNKRLNYSDNYTANTGSLRDTNVKSIKDNNLKPTYQDQQNTTPSALDRMGENAKYIARSGKNALSAGRGTIVSMGNSIINAITGGLGNIYEQGHGIQGALDAVGGELGQQVKSLQSKITGNINDSAIKISETATSTVLNPVLGTINEGGAIVDKKLDEAHQEVVGQVKSLGDITYESQEELANQLGVNRLNNTKLGNIYQY